MGETEMEKAMGAAARMLLLNRPQEALSLRVFE